MYCEYLQCECHETIQWKGKRGILHIREKKRESEVNEDKTGEAKPV